MRRRSRPSSVFSLAIVCILPLAIHADQVPLRHAVYHYDNVADLPPVEFSGCLQDSLGFLWFWGPAGVLRYTGAEFQSFGVAEGLPNEYVYTMHIMPDSSLLIGTFRGTARYSPATGKVTTLPIRDKRPAKSFLPLNDGMLLGHDHGISFIRGYGEYRITFVDSVGAPIVDFVGSMANDTKRNGIWVVGEWSGPWFLETSRIDSLTRFRDSKLQGEYERLGEREFEKHHPGVLAEPSTWLVGGDSARAAIAGSILHRIPVRYRNPGARADRLYVSGNGEVLLNSEDGLYRYNEQEFIPAKTPSEAGSRFTFTLDDRGIRYYGSDKGLYLNGVGKSLFLASDRDLQGAEPRVWMTDRSGTIWIGKQGAGLCRVSSSELLLHGNDNFSGLDGNHGVVELPEGSFIQAGSREIFQFRNNRFEQLILTRKLISDIWGLALDKNGDLLIATGLELLLYRFQTGEMKLLFSGEQGSTWRAGPTTLPDGTVSLILDWHWLEWDGADLHDHGRTLNAPTFITTTRDSSLYISTWVELVRRDRTGFTMFDHNSIEWAKEWVWGNRKEVKPISQTNGIDRPVVFCGTSDNSGAMWFGTFSAGIWRIEGDSVQIWDDRNGIPAGPYLNAIRRKDGSLLFNTSERLFQIRDNAIQEVDVEIDPLVKIVSLAESPAGELIIGTTHGLEYRNGNETWKIDRGTGIGADRVERIHLLKNGLVQVTLPHGVLQFNPKRLAKDLGPTQSPVVTDVFAGSERIDPGKSIRFPVGVRALRIKYTLPQYFNESRNRYRWKLVGLDHEYRPITSETEAIIENMPPGRYSFRLTAWDGLGRETELRQPITIFIPRYYYETLWFYLLCFAFVGGLAIAVIYWRIKLLQNQKRYLEERVRQSTAEAMEQFNRAKQAEIEAEQLKTATLLAAAVAHEFNNPLAVIKAGVELIELADISPEKQQDIHVRIKRQVERMKILVQKLLRIREVREIDYAAGMKILDIHSIDEEYPANNFDSFELKPFKNSGEDRTE